jgi:hypothetical protein
MENLTPGAGDTMSSREYEEREYFVVLLNEYSSTVRFIGELESKSEVPHSRRVVAS